MLKSYDSRRNIAICKNLEAALRFSVDHWIESAKAAIEKRGRFTVALSGGSTPKAIFKLLSSEHKQSLDWSKVWVFWSDERAVAPDHPDSNYRMAMESGFGFLPIPPHQIFRMKAEEKIDQEALFYEQQIRKHCGSHLFDLIMLGLGEDGHTASLFPQTHALNIEDCLVVPNFVPALHSWRMTLTFACINKSRQATIYAFGSAKSAIVKKIFEPSCSLPASQIGTPTNKSLWILDESAATQIDTF